MSPSVARQLSRTRDFYVDLMGLTEGERPAFPSAAIGFIWAGFRWSIWSRPPTTPAPGAGTLCIPKAEDGTGAFDHVAFQGDDFEAMRNRLKEAGVTFKERVVPGGRLKQLFVPDPEGVLVEINFRND